MASTLSRAARRRRRERIFALIALPLIAIFWVAGSLRAQGDRLPAIQSVFPDADHVVRQDGELYTAWADSSEEQLLGYVALGEASGYGGPLTLAVAVNPEGQVFGAVIVDHKETAGWMS